MLNSITRCSLNGRIEVLKQHIWSYQSSEASSSLIRCFLWKRPKYWSHDNENMENWTFWPRSNKALFYLHRIYRIFPISTYLWIDDQIFVNCEIFLSKFYNPNYCIFGHSGDELASLLQYWKWHILKLQLVQLLFAGPNHICGQGLWYIKAWGYRDCAVPQRPPMAVFNDLDLCL